MLTDLLADLLVAASERGPVRLWEIHRQLVELVGPDVVHAAHREWTRRLWEAVLGERPVSKPAQDTTHSAPDKRCGSPAGQSESAFQLVRRLPDPSKGGQAGQAAR